MTAPELGCRAHGEPAAWFVLQELLHSPLPELRLRGVSALGTTLPRWSAAPSRRPRMWMPPPPSR